MASSEASFDEDADEPQGFVIGYMPDENKTGEEMTTQDNPKGDRRTVVHQRFGGAPEDLLKPPWKNIFLLYADETHMRGTAFLTDITREHDGVQFAVLLTCAHNLCRKVPQKHENDPKCELVTSIKLYQAYELSDIRPNAMFTNADCFLDMRSKQSLARRKGWFAVFPGYLQSPNCDLDVGFIFVHMAYMDAMLGSDGMKNCTTVAPKSIPNPKTTEGFVAGFPCKYGGKYGLEKPTHYLLTCGGNVMQSSPIMHGVEAHDADTSKGNSGSPYLIEERDSRGTETCYAVGIHCHGFRSGAFSKLYGATTPQDIQMKNPLALNAYRIIDNNVIELIQTLPAVP